MVAKGGDRLLRDEAVAALRERLLPLAHLITPNLPEAGALLRAAEPGDRAGMEADGASACSASGRPMSCSRAAIWPAPRAPTCCCPAASGSGSKRPRIATRHTHGTGCTLSSAIAALLARGLPLPDAVAEAKRWLTEAIAAGDGLGIGHGIGPVHHFHALWPALDEAADGCLTRRPA